MRLPTRRERLRTYEGRVLARQDEDVEDQGLGFDVGTLLGRRQLLAFGGAGAAALGLAACGTDSAVSATTSSSTATAAASAGALTEIPDETAGPYPGDGSNGADALEESGIIRSDIRSSFGSSTTTAEGVPMTLRLNVVDLANGGAAYEGAAVYVWHCNQAGEYSMYSSGIEDENYLRGVQVVDADGMVEFTSIFPACYSGRWPHIHFEVYPDVASITDSTNNIATSQVALPQATCDTVYATAGYEASVSNLAQVTLATDNVFSDDSGASQTPTVTGDVTSGFVLTLPVGVDATTAAVQGMAPSGGGGAGGAGAGGGQGGPGGGGPGGTPPSGGTPPAGAPTDAASATTTS